MKNRNVKVIDDHNIDRNANVMFALDLEGSEYVVYWIERDETSNNVLVSKVLKNIDGTYSMINIDDDDKKKDVSDIVKMLISNAVNDQNDKLVGTTVTLSNGKNVRFMEVSFNKEQNINVSKTYITTVKKEVTKVAEDYYDVVLEENKVAEVLPSVTPVLESVSEVFPEMANTIAPVEVNTLEDQTNSVPNVEPIVVAQPVVEPTPIVIPTPVEEVQKPVQTVAPEVIVSNPTQVVMPVVEPIVVPQPVAEPTPVVIPTPVVEAEPVVQAVSPEPVSSILPQQPVVPPVVETPVVANSVVNPQVEPIKTDQTLVFNAAKETNLNAALGEVANSASIPVDNIAPVREFGVESPVVQPVVSEPVVQTVTPSSVTSTVLQQPVVAPMVQQEMAAVPKTLTKKAGFANNKFFMVVAIAFFLASCVFLGYEVFKYFQLTK